ncbi:hypothetical protein FQN54_005623 [Arachnomyces sp. PD_36]|nr:hypothetical protein FQN54_005623 [Arachnomyces sp. PD_36]
MGIQNDQNGQNGQNGHEQNGKNENNGTAVNERIAVTANAPDDVPGLLERITSDGEAFTQDEAGARMKLLDAARSLVYALETPRETMIRYCWSQAATYASIETAVETGVFSAMSKDDNAKSVAELAEATNVDPAVLSRIMKHLGATGVVAEAASDSYRPTGFSNSLTIQKYGDGFPCMTSCITDGTLAIPEFLRKNGYKLPTSGKDCAFQLGYKTDLHFFEYLGANPKVGNEFNRHMSAYRQGRPGWMDHGFFPVEEQLIDGARTGDEDIFVVDVGGGLGHDLMEFGRKWPNTPGRLILQDQAYVIDDAKPNLHKSIEPMVHDFFTEQPAKGARAYYMHSILHDWPDDVSLKILTHLADAMTPGYSKILINENVIPDTDAYWETTALDIIMMGCFASQERTEKQWRKLLSAAGLKVLNVWTVERGVESLIECELA